MTALPSRARAVVVGGGITGTSVAYHLAQAGWRDTVLLEKAELTSGSTCHAAGLVTQFNPSPPMMRFRRYSIELYRRLGIFETVGSLRFASSREQLLEQQRGVSRARAIGLDVEVVSAEQAAQLMPAVSKDFLFGAVWVPGDGAIDPHTAAFALANAARELGVKVLTGTRVTGIELSSAGGVQAVRTEAGRIEAEVVVIACGIWAPQVAAMAGAFVVSTPVDHQHAALQAVQGAQLPQSMPCFRDPDNLIYGKAEAGGVVLGGYEPNPNARWIDGVPWEHAVDPPRVGVRLIATQHHAARLGLAIDEVVRVSKARHALRELRALDGLQCGVLVVDRRGHDKRPGHGGHLRRPDATRDDDHLSLDPPNLRLHRLHPTARGELDAGHPRVREHRHPKL